ncbi:LysR substrate-binding domain-containing protein [Streptomyces coeruleorubidus]|uniref:LysR substrate-binding domain-containing protein n=1 Tax=Streptomyces coeruleorubidus TaxID=116188 RepID=UPI0036AB78C5
MAVTSSPATLTRTVQRLEADLGHRLFDRGPRGVSLTAEGHRFREYAVRALELWRACREEHPHPAELTVRLGLFATVTACQALLPDLLAPFRAAHPQVRLGLRTGDAAAALARLDAGEVDAAVAGIPPRLPESLASRTVAVTELVLVTARDRPDPGLDGPFVLPHRGLVRYAADRWFRARGTAADVACEPDGHEGLLTLVALGCGTGAWCRAWCWTTARCGSGWRWCRRIRRRSRFPIGLCVRRADLRRPLVAALWSLAGPGARPEGPE